MKRTALIALAALAVSAALASPFRPTRRDRERYVRRNSVLLSFAPTSGAGLPVVADLCDTYASEMTGNYFCMRGDGTSLDGGLTLTAVGSPTTQTIPLCPNGSDCTPVSSQRYTSTAMRHTTIAQPSPTGDFSVCGTYKRDAFAGAAGLIDKDDGAAARGIIFRPQTTGKVSLIINASSTLDATSGTVTGAWDFVCATYDYVTSGTSVARLYLDGVAVGVDSTFVGPPTVASQPWTVGGWASVPSFDGNIRNAFFTEKILTPTVIAAMAHTALADNAVAATGGQAITMARSSSSFCTDSSGVAGNFLPLNRACIRNGALLSESARTNRALRSQEFDHAAWTATNAGATIAVTANTTDVRAPDGTNTAEKVVIAGVDAVNDYSFLQQTITVTAAAHSDSVFLRSASGTKTIYLTMQNGATWLNQACVMTASAWSRCKLENQTLTATGWQMNIGLDLRTGSGQVAQADPTFYIWQAQRETGGWATSPIYTTSATVTRSAEFPSISPLPDLGATPSVSIRIRPVSTLINSVNFFDTRGGGGLAGINVGYSLSRQRCDFDNGGGVHESVSSGVINWAVGTSVRIGCQLKPDGTITGYLDGVANGTTGSGLHSNGSQAFIGAAVAGNEPDSEIYDVCLSRSPTGCAP